MERNQYLPMNLKLEPMEPMEPTKNNDGYDLEQLPNLLSLEPPPPLDLYQELPYPPPPLLSGDLSLVIEPSEKHFRPPAPLQTPNPRVLPSTSMVIRPTQIPMSEIARRRRRKIGDRIKALQSLMPWERKMDMATMLEEAHKYVRFLEAQVTALQSMPVGSAGFVPVPVQTEAGSGLGRLNRQQLMQVMLNSPAIQDVMCRNGVCLFSSEQVVTLRRMAAVRVLRL